MIVYLDSDFKCHVSPGEGLTAAETDAFDGRCAAYIEGYRFVPAGATWIREDGAVFAGEMLTPWMPYEELTAAQREYEFEQLHAELEDAKAALALLGVTEEVTPDAQMA